MTNLWLPALLLGLPIAVSAQWQKKPPSEWSQKEVLSILNNSPWAQTQAFADTEKMFDSSKTLDANPNRVAETARTNFRVRFFSAKPVRQAITRLIAIKQKGGVSDELASQLQALVDAKFSDYVVVTLLVDTEEAGNQRGAVATMLDKQMTSQLKSETFLLVKGGERVFLQEYQAPRRDGFGARFIFPRNPDNKPLIGPDSSEILFHTQLNGGPTISLRFKVKEMMWEGKLEY